jgi:hypothetical protein
MAGECGLKKKGEGLANFGRISGHVSIRRKIQRSLSESPGESVLNLTG